MALFNEKTATQLKNVLDQAAAPVQVDFFTQEFECRACADARAFAEEISALSDKLKLTVHDFVKDGDRAGAAGVDKLPALVLSDAGGTVSGVTFYGVPGGYEINSFLGAVLELSGRREPVAPDLAKRIAAVKKDVHIQVFIMLSCPYCPDAVGAAHRLAMESPSIRADMIDLQLYPHLAQKYEVKGVPLTVINESVRLAGPQRIETLVGEIEKL